MPQTHTELKESSCFSINSRKFFSTFAMCEVGLARITEEAHCILSSFKKIVLTGILAKT